LAGLYEKIGDYNKALEYMDMAEALGEGEYNPDFWLQKGELMKALGRYDEALACYERGLMLSGEDERYIRLFTEAIERLRRKRK